MAIETPVREVLVTDYLVAKELAIYLPDGKVEDINVAGERVMCVENSDCGYYTQNHMIALLDILAWVYAGGAK